MKFDWRIQSRALPRAPREPPWSGAAPNLPGARDLRDHDGRQQDLVAITMPGQQVLGAVGMGIVNGYQEVEHH